MLAAVVNLPLEILDRMERAVLKVRERLLRSTSALNRAGIPYAVVGGHAVASWVATVDEGAVRNTRDVDLLVRRDDLPAITVALEAVGFVRAEVMDVIMFRDGPDGKPSESVHLLFSGEILRAGEPFATPDIATVPDPGDYRVIELGRLVRMKLLSYRLKDRVHLHDLLAQKLIDSDWLPRLPELLAERLKEILDNPESTH